MKLSMNVLLACFFASLLVTLASAFLYVVAYIEIGGAPQERINGCGVQVLVYENDRYVTVCPEDSLKGKVSAFLAPKAAVASIVLLVVIVYQWSKGAVARKSIK